ncbi:hypothetical protein MICPUN_113308 [Micromonas commoda]|uniref:Fe2OG dioxygenase domain-containing protein n=1 Tax=Micromonas commoda (strain RCC299 / NOUM17 / CCMP2709) TaxID=296587 RepID=C1FJI8_MICCC|nr:hypothetical protein MICPUN_113308 [Micromonas commoda]ACO70606.1 hypothetical protein MICPUN_113308 [Micromonas commoda]|eukprot:XP_002509348.1 hypothetical protein MICPUN_113308 [Micromonas commoda]
MEGELPPLARPLLTNRDETTVGFADDWTPSHVKVALNLTLNAEFVPASANVRDLSSLPGAPSGCRAAVARVVALDGLIDKTALGWIREHLGVDIEDERRHGGAKPRESLWERKTADDDLAEPTYGLRKESMDRLVRTMMHREGVEPTTRLDEFHARLQALYPDWIVCHMPADALRADEEASEKPDDSLDASAGGSAGFRCDAFVANAAVHGDEYRWHVDADPSSFPDSCAWTRTYGDYVNGEPGKPLFVSAVVYANSVWDEDAWGGETHFMDVGSGVGALVCPRPGRVVLMDQDVTHRVSPPTRAANGRARYSLVYKLVFFPRAKGGAAGPDASLWERGIARAEWGPPSPIGSAAKLAAIVNAAARARRTETGAVKRDREEE